MSLINYKLPIVGFSFLFIVVNGPYVSTVKKHGSNCGDNTLS